MISSRLVKRGSIRHTTWTLIAAYGTGVPILGWTTLKAYVGDIEVLIHGLVSEHIVDVMLGVDWLKDNEVVWNFTAGDGLGSRQHQGHPRRRYPRQQSRVHAVSYRVWARSRTGTGRQHSWSCSRHWQPCLTGAYWTATCNRKVVPRSWWSSQVKPHLTADVLSTIKCSLV